MHSNTIVLDLETAHSADDCRYCGREEGDHLQIIADARPSRCRGTGIPGRSPTWYKPIGWDDKAALGLSIGCYWDYADSRIHWFDAETLESTVRHLVERQPLLVSFNGIGFDFVLMRGLLRQEVDREARAGESQYAYPRELHKLCDQFKAQGATSYDILAEIWQADPSRKFERGLNSLDAIAQANALGAKLGYGAQAPRDWAAGRYANVLNYCQDDVYKTKTLYEIIQRDGGLVRGDGVFLALPAIGTLGATA